MLTQMAKFIAPKPKGERKEEEKEKEKEKEEEDRRYHRRSILTFILL